MSSLQKNIIDFFSRSSSVILLIIFCLATITPGVLSANNCNEYFNNRLSKQTFAQKFSTFKKQLDERLSSHTAWEFSKQQEAEFELIFADKTKTDYEKFNNFFHSMNAARLSQVSPLSRFFIKRALADLLKQRSLYSLTLGKLLEARAGPHYNPVFNRTAIKFKNKKDLSVDELLVAFHESQHLFDRNTQPIKFLGGLYPMVIELFMILRAPTTPLITRHWETRAIQAQWELARRIPKEFREIILAEFNLTPKTFTDNKFEGYTQLLLHTNILEKTSELLRLLQNQGVINKFDTPEALKRAAIRQLIQGNYLSNKTLKAAKSTLSTIFEKKEALNYFRLISKGLRVDPLDIYGLKTFDKGAIKNFKTREFFLRKEINEYTKSNTEKQIESVFIHTLENSEIPKDQFIKKLSEAHGYSLKALYKHHYRFSTFKQLLVLDAFIRLNVLYANNFEGDPQFYANDLRLVWKLYTYLFLGQ